MQHQLTEKPKYQKNLDCERMQLLLCNSSGVHDGLEALLTA